jgi:hypothetical protein
MEYVERILEFQQLQTDVSIKVRGHEWYLGQIQHTIAVQTQGGIIAIGLCASCKPKTQITKQNKKPQRGRLAKGRVQGDSIVQQQTAACPFQPEPHVTRLRNSTTVPPKRNRIGNPKVTFVPLMYGLRRGLRSHDNRPCINNDRVRSNGSGYLLDRGRCQNLLRIQLGGKNVIVTL